MHEIDIVKAKKVHLCNYCKTPIHIGEMYHRERWLEEDEESDFIGRRTIKLHCGCVEAYENCQSKLERQYDHWEQWYEQIFV